MCKCCAMSHIKLKILTGVVSSLLSLASLVSLMFFLDRQVSRKSKLLTHIRFFTFLLQCFWALKLSLLFKCSIFQKVNSEGMTKEFVTKTSDNSILFTFDYTFQGPVVLLIISAFVASTVIMIISFLGAYVYYIENQARRKLQPGWSQSCLKLIVLAMCRLVLK